RRHPLDLRDAALGDLDGEELLRGPVAARARAEKLESAFDHLVIAQRFGQQRRGLVDPLAEHDWLVAAAAGRHARAFLACGSDGVLEVEALDRALAPEAGLRALAGDVGAVGLQVEVDGLCHVDASVSFWSMRPRA